MNLELASRAGLARILGVSESGARFIEARGEIAPVAVVSGRPLFSVADAEALRAKRDAARRVIGSRTSYRSG